MWRVWSGTDSAAPAGGIRGFLSEVYQLRPFVIFAVVLIAVVIAMVAAGWGNILCEDHFEGDDGKVFKQLWQTTPKKVPICQSPKHAVAVIA